VRKIGFLEVGFDPGPALGDQREQRYLRLHLLAGLKAEIEDGAGAGCLDLGVVQIQRSAVAQRDLLPHGRVTVGRLVRIASEGYFDAADRRLQQSEGVALLLLLAVGLLDPRRRADAAAGKLALALRLQLQI